MDVLDQRLPPSREQTTKDVVFAVTVGLACTCVTVKSQPSMRFVAQELSAGTQACLEEPLGTITISMLAGLKSVTVRNRPVRFNLEEQRN